MIHLYTWATPNGRKISVALEEMGLPYQVHTVDLSKGEQHDPAFMKINPNHAIPAIVDDETGLILVESSAILLYLSEKSGRLMPSDTREKWQAIQWLMWQTSGQGPMLGQAHHFLKFNPGKAPYAEERYHSQAKRIYGELNTRLEGREFVAGSELTITDIAIWCWTSRYEYHQIGLTEYPNVLRWYLALAARPAFLAGYRVPDPSLDIPLP